jgi:hypothetical protein
MTHNNNNEECCPLFNPDKWDKLTHEWNNKQFIMESMPTLFHMPLPPIINKKMTKLNDLAEKADALEADKLDILVLFHDPSAFKSEIMWSVNKEVSGANNVTVSGTFVSKVFDGPYNDVPKFMKEMDSYLAERGKKALDYYVHYAYCPGCAKKHGHNYVVLFAKV